jgi:hypothetical protein
MSPEESYAILPERWTIIQEEWIKDTIAGDP